MNKAVLLSPGAKFDSIFDALDDVTTQFEPYQDVLINSSCVNNLTLTDSDLTNLATKIKTMTRYLYLDLSNFTLPNEVNHFQDCTFIKNIDLPSTITKIGNNAFKDCKALESITMPNTITQIGDDAFNGCRSILKITLPSGLVSIGERAFRQCSALSSIVIPEGVTSVNTEAFLGCPFESVTFPSTLQIIKKGISSNKLKSLIVPNGVTTLDTDAFYMCMSLSNLELPNTLTTIKTNAFGNCYDLYTLNIPSSVNNIAAGAFTGSMINTFIFSSAVPPCTGAAFNNIDNPRYVIYVPNANVATYKSAFGSTVAAHVRPTSGKDTNTVYDESYSLSTMLSEIAAFTDRYTKITIKGTGFEDKTLPDGSLGLAPFGDRVPKGITQQLNELEQQITLDLSEFEFDNYTIPDYAFYKCKCLKEVILPNNITTIGNSAFEECNNLCNITLSNNITSIGKKAFSWCVNLHQINLPNHTINFDGGFYNGVFQMSGLETLVIPNGTTTIPEYFCGGCRRLQQVTIPETVTTISKDAFYATNIKTINLPNGLNTFLSIIAGSSIKEITIPENVTDINASFGECFLLQSITILSNNVPTIAANLLDYIASGVYSFPNMLIYVPDDKVAAYKAITNLAPYAHKIKPLSEKGKNVIEKIKLPAVDKYVKVKNEITGKEYLVVYNQIE